MSTEFASNYFESLMRTRDIYDNLYFAGLFDGEGCVTIDKRLSDRGRATAIYHVSVQIAMVDRRPLDDIVKLYGVGGVYKASFGRLALSQAWRWCAVSRHAEKFLRAIRPYLRIKAEEVDIALAFQEHVKANDGRGKKSPPEVVAFREDCRVRLQHLKRRFRVHQ